MASMKDFLIKNDSGSDQLIADLGIIIPDSTSVPILDLGEQFPYYRIYASDDLRNLVDAGTLILNDGTDDLTQAEAIEYLFSINDYELKQDYYSKTQISSPGQSNVHWDNVTNAPPIGSISWLDPVRFFVLDIGLATPPVGTLGDIYIDDVNAYLRYNGTIWEALGSSVSSHRVINLQDLTEDIFEFNGSWVSQGQTDNAAAVMVKYDKNEDGSYNEAQYIYSGDSTSWIKIGDVDFSGHLDGGPGKHDASEIDVEGTYSNISGTPTDLESTVSGIDLELGTLHTDIDTRTLDDSYDAGGSGAGRLIDTDSGPIELDRGVATSPSFRIVPKGSLPSTGLQDGDIDIINGILCVYDATRGLWLSCLRQNVLFGDSGNVKNRYLNVGTGNVVSSNSGPRMIEDSCIVGISTQLSQSGSCDIRVRKNGILTNITTLNITSSIGTQDSSLNINLNIGDFLQVYIQCQTPVKNPVVLIEFAKRL